MYKAAKGQYYPENRKRQGSRKLDRLQILNRKGRVTVYTPMYLVCHITIDIFKQNLCRCAQICTDNAGHMGCPADISDTLNF